MGQPHYPPHPQQWGPPPPPPKKNTGKILALIGGLAVLSFLIGGGAAILTNTPENTAAPAPAPAASTPAAAETAVSPECRAWVKEELMEASEDINAGSGYAACGTLSDEQWDAVTEDVTKEISDDPSALAEATKTEAEKFQDCVKRTGTDGEKAAAAHVTKVTGTDDPNNIADSADVFTDYTGGMLGPHQGDGKLIASAFASCYSSQNGLVTVYDKDGDLLSTGRW